MLPEMEIRLFSQCIPAGLRPAYKRKRNRPIPNSPKRVAGLIRRSPRNRYQYITTFSLNRAQNRCWFCRGEKTSTIVNLGIKPKVQERMFPKKRRRIPEPAVRVFLRGAVFSTFCCQKVAPKASVERKSRGTAVGSSSRFFALRNDGALRAT